jgi:hypothetical protein
MWRALVIDSLRRPRLAARRILDAGLPDAAVIEAAILVTCAGIVLGYLALRATPDGIDMVSRAMFANPLVGAVAQLATMLVVILLTVRIGRLFGGHGDLWGAAALVVWLNAMLVLVQAGQLVALALLPPLAALLAIAATIWALWAYANFIAELHGFQNPVIVLGAVVLTGIMLFFSTAMLLAILGLTPREVG